MGSKISWPSDDLNFTFVRKRESSRVCNSCFAVRASTRRRVGGLWTSIEPPHRSWRLCTETLRFCWGAARTAQRRRLKHQDARRCVVRPRPHFSLLIAVNKDAAAPTSTKLCGRRRARTFALRCLTSWTTLRAQADALSRRRLTVHQHCAFQLPPQRLWLSVAWRLQCTTSLESRQHKRGRAQCNMMHSHKLEDAVLQTAMIELRSQILALFFDFPKKGEERKGEEIEGRVHRPGPR